MKLDTLKQLRLIMKKSKSMWDYLKILKSDDTLILNCKDLEVEEIDKNIRTSFEKKDYRNVLLVTENRSYDNIDYLSRYPNIYIQYDEKYPLSFCSIEEFKMMREKIDYYKSLMSNSSLSPLEQITYIYDFVKSRRYNDSGDDISDSRSIHRVLSTDKVVCTGYVLLMGQILTELGYDCYDITLHYEGEESTHSQIMVRIKDDKYGIDGCYVFDPTADSAKNMYHCLEKDGSESIKYETELEKTDKVLYDFGKNASYRAFLIPLRQYGSVFGDNIDIVDMNHNDVTSEFIDDILAKEEFTGVELGLFFNVMYNVRCFQSYSKEDALNNVCGLVATNFVYPDDELSVSEVISKIDNSYKAEARVYTKKNN